MSDRAKKLMELSVAAKRYAEAIGVSMRASDSRAALGPHATRARITSANARWARCAEDRDRKEDRFKLAMEVFDGEDHSEDILDMVAPTCKDVLQVADDTAVRKEAMPGIYGPLWVFNEQRICELARRLSIAPQPSHSPGAGKMVASAQAVIQRWDSPLWKQETSTAELINNLRKDVDAYLRQRTGSRGEGE